MKIRLGFILGGFSEMYLISGCWAARVMSLGGGGNVPRCYIPAILTLDGNGEIRCILSERVHSIYLSS